jgi:ABC-type sugar transport system ATPase subunit
MDEPTSSLSDKEVDALFERIRLLTKQGVGIIYISHRMSELQQIADRVTVLRDGEFIATKVVKETTNDELIALMVGREITNYYTRTFNSYDEVVLKVENLCSPVVSNVSFELKKGEILGFAGLIGAGRSEAMKAIFGIDRITSGSIYLNGEKLTIQKPSDALKHGICLVPEDRKMEGVFPIQSIKFNSTLKVLDKFIKGIHVNYTKEDNVTDEYMKNLSIKAPDSNYLVGSLSGGNQQKVVLASWLATNPKVLIMDEPTRGIDVHAKSEIYAIMNELAKSGISIIMVSSELPEVLNMSDRIIVMSEGKITAVYDRLEATQEKIMQYAVKM